jgi:biotin carboxyl carrier protein
MRRMVLPVPGADPVSVEVRWSKEVATVVVGAADEANPQVEVEVTLAGPHEGMVRYGNRATPFLAARVGEELNLWLLGRLVRFPSGERASSGSGTGAAIAAALSGDVTAPMPGRVLKLFVGPGDVVQARQPLVSMESMKMELSLPAPAAGKVAEVLVPEGAMVDIGALLVRLELET